MGTLGIATLDTLVDLTGLDKGLSDAKTKSEKGLGALAGRTAKLLTGVVAGAATVALGAVVGLTAAVVDFTMEAAAVEGVQNTFDALVESVGGDTVQAMDDLRAATRGMVADADLMAASNKFLAMGIATSTEEAAEMAEVATQLGSAMGEDATDSMENFALMMANQSIPRLDSFGISSSVVRERILELTAANADMTREQAFNQAVMEQAALTMDKVGEQGATTKASMDRLKATFANAKLTIGQAFLPLLDIITKIAERVLPRLQEKFNEVMEFITPLIETATEVVFSFFNYMEQGNGILDSLLMAFGEWGILTEEQIAWIMNLREQIIEFKDRLMEFLQPIIDVIVQFVSWKDVLIVLAAAVAAVVLPIIWGIVTAIAPVILAIAAAIAIVALLRNVWENDWGGIRTFLVDTWENKLKPALLALWEWLKIKVPEAMEALKAFWNNKLKPAIMDLWEWFKVKVPLALAAVKKFWEEKLKPAIMDLWEWLKEKVPAAIETLKMFWEEKLLPAIEKVWGFIKEDLVPLFVALWELLGVAGGLALDILAGIWENVLQPALETVWEFIQDKIMPIFREVWEFVKDKLSPIIEGAGGFFSDLSGFIQSVIDRIIAFKDSLEGIADKLPDWMKRSSPSKIELTLSGMAEGLKDAQAQLSGFAMELGGLAGGGSSTRIGTNIEQFTLNAPTVSPSDTTVQNVQMAFAMAGA